MELAKQNSPFQTLLRYGDWFLGMAVVGLLLILVAPLPSFLLDILIGLNMTISILILLVVTNASSPLELSTFPSILLFTTLMRLTVNVATTRAILLHGEAGSVIQAFGDFVLGGSVVVGIVVFIIIVTINFIVITKGQNRIGEVAARFTLDAMPGKQMAIDADLNAGIISSEEARERRAELQREAEFFGAMDGAGRFVRGDAVAGIVIIFVNILGGVILGWMNGMEFMDALNHYVILTVGDGLVSQIPTLLIAMAAGVLVTKTTSKTQLATEIGLQILSKPRALAVGSGLLVIIGLIPGLPKWPFFTLAAFFGLLYSRAKNFAQDTKAEKESKEKETTKSDASLEGKAIDDLLTVDRLSVEIGYRLIPLVDPESGTGLLGHIAVMRRQFATHEGLLIPPIRIKDNIRLEPNGYRILISGQETGKGSLMPGHFLAMDGGSVEKPVHGIETTDPSFGLPALWITPEIKDEAEILGYTVVDPVSVLVTHISEILRSQAHEILTRDDVKHLLDNLKKKMPAVVEELVPGLLPVGEVQKVLRNLLKERVPIRNLSVILETLADHASQTKDVDMLTELVRQRLARVLCDSYVDTNGKLFAITLDPEVENRLSEVATARAGKGGDLSAVSPSYLRKVVDSVGLTINKTSFRGKEPVILAKAPVRKFIHDLLATTMPRVPVLSYSEIAPAQSVESLAVVRVDEK